MHPYKFSTIAILALISCFLVIPPIASADQRPNILLVTADDMGWTDLGSFGSEIDTPNLDTLAREGVKFTDFHTSMSCSPTRSMLMSGTDNHLAGLGNMGDLLVSGPGIKSGVQNDAFAYVWDIMPTILDFTGISHPEKFNNWKVERMRGKSLKAIPLAKKIRFMGRMPSLAVRC